MLFTTRCEAWLSLGRCLLFFWTRGALWVVLALGVLPFRLLLWAHGKDRRMACSGRLGDSFFKTKNHIGFPFPERPVWFLFF